MIRKILFWSHLVVGLVAGIVVFVLCLSGALLAFEKPSLDWAERTALALPPPGITERLPADVLVTSASKVEPARPTSVRYVNDPKMPARVAFAGATPVLVNAYTGVVLGRSPTSLRAFYAFVRRAHVALTLSGEPGKTGSSIVAVGNLAFVFLSLTGLYLWWPRRWKWSALRNSVALRFNVGGKARDWNWHNALGFWALIPLLLMAVSGIVLSYDWANLGLREFASQHGAPPVASTTFALPETGAVKPGWSAILAETQRFIPGWRSINIPWSAAPPSWVTISVSEGYESEPLKHVGLTFDWATAAVAKVDRWENRGAGERARAIARTGHTGEIGGLPGQTLAGLGCLAGVVLVYTGAALSWRRFFRRRRRPTGVETPPAQTLETTLASS